MALLPVSSSLYSPGYMTGGVFFKTGDSRLAINNTGTAWAPNGYFYLDRLDAIMGSIGSANGTGLGLVQLDPLFLSNTAPIARFENSFFPSAAPVYFAVGEWDKIANVQKFYAQISASPFNIHEIDPATFDYVTAGGPSDPSDFPFGFTFRNNSEPGGLLQGWWKDQNSANGNLIFFETWGFSIKACAECRHTDNVLYRGLVLIDNTTGLGVLQPLTTFHTNTPGDLFEGPPILGDETYFGTIQFIPDDDSVPSAPKGRIFLASDMQGPNVGGVPSVGEVHYQYVKMFDFNPLDVVAAPGFISRVHWRQTLLSRIDYREREAAGTNTNSAGDFTDGGTYNVNTRRKPIFHPPSSNILTLINHRSGTNYNEHTVVRTSLVAALDHIDPPTPLEAVATNKLVSVRTAALGTLGEPIAGLDATWSVQRKSSSREVLLTVGGPASSIVANTPIDSGTLVVEFDALGDGVFVTLTLTTDYTVVESTGTITWAGAHAPPNAAPAVYVATYEHATSPASPGHGSVVNLIVQTNAQGISDAEIAYPDDDQLVGGIDEITVSVEQ